MAYGATLAPLRVEIDAVVDVGSVTLDLARRRLSL